MFTHKKHDIKRPFVERVDPVEVGKNSGHYYRTDKGDIYPSITTVIHSFPNPGIERWKANTPNWQEISKGSTDVGTALHKLAEDYLNNEKITVEKSFSDFEVNPYELFESSLKPHLDKYVDNIHGTESKLYSDKLRLAGTVDLVAEYDGVLSVIDFKNSRKPKIPSYIKNSKYYEQGTAYSEMWKECTGMDIEQVVILVVSWDGKVRPFKTKKQDHISSLWDILIKYETFI